jgi:two-component system cell cycle response regulator
VRARHKLLIIDDSELSLQLVSGVLHTAGYEVRTSTGVNELDATLGDWRPDVILTDVNMPGMSGVELCRRLKSAYETAHVPVVLFSALPHAELEVLARNCEADGFLCKSGLDQLVAELELLIDTALF